MKLRLKSFATPDDASTTLRSQTGSALILVLVFAGILTLVLGVYLNMTSTESKNSTRSLAWNAALPLAEAGVEEAMSQMFINTNDFSADGWTQQGTNLVYLKQRTLGTDKYSVIIEGAPGAPVTIYSTGSVYVASSGAYVSRTVEVDAFAMTMPNPEGMIARIIAFGGGVYIDSYDSSNPLQSNPANNTTGFYDPNLATDVAFVGNPVGPLNITGNSTILGFAAAAPGFTVNASGSATISSTGWAGKGIQRTPLDHGTNGFTHNMPSVSVPFHSGSTPTSGIVNGTNFTYVLSGGYYMASNLVDLNYGKTMYVSSPSKLYVTGTIDLSQIVFTNGARLDLYLAQANVLVPSVVGAPTQFIIWGLDTCTTLQLSSSSTVVAILYAPKTDLKSSGGAQFIGAMTANSFRSTGHFAFHHDQGSLNSIMPKPLAIQAWRELTTPGS
jgi:hypothetical protein